MKAGVPEHCQTCGLTDREYSHTARICSDPWHGDDHLRAKASAQSPILTKRPVAFRVPRTVRSMRAAVGIEWRYFTDEAKANAEAEERAVDCQGLYVRDGTAIVAEWKPIETAPTDGTWILIWESAGTNTKYSPADVAHYHLGDWYNSDKQRLYSASHWMPLPAPPALSNGGS